MELAFRMIEEREASNQGGSYGPRSLWSVLRQLPLMTSEDLSKCIDFYNMDVNMEAAAAAAVAAAAAAAVVAVAAVCDLAQGDEMQNSPRVQRRVCARLSVVARVGTGVSRHLRCSLSMT